MKIELILDGYIPASTTLIAEVPDDVTEEELDAIKEDLLVKDLDEDGIHEVSCVVIREIVPDHCPAELQVVREDGQLLVEEVEE